MDKKRIIIIVCIVAIIVAVGFGISKIITASQDDFYMSTEVEYNYYKTFSNGKYGVINKKGELIVNEKYDDIIIPNPSKAVFICQYNYNPETEYYDYVILNEKGEEIFKNYTNVEAISVTGIIGNIPYEKYALKYKEDNKYGLLSIDGNEITKPLYEEVSSVPYKEGVFLVKENGKYGVVTIKGSKLINTEYDSIVGDGYFNNENGYNASCFLVTKGDSTGYISERGEMILPTEYDSIYRIKELPEKYIIAQKNGQYGLLNDTKIIIGFNYQELTFDENSNLFIAKRNKNYGVLNIYGNKVLPIEFNSISIDGLYIIATKNETTEKYTLNGEIVTNDLYASVRQTTGDYYISIDKNYNYGILDKNMNVVIANKYGYLDYVSDNLIIVRMTNGKYGIIDIQDQTKIDGEYDVMQLIKGTKIVQGIILDTNTLHLYNLNVDRIYNEKNASIYTFEDYLKVSTSNKVNYFNNDGVEVQNTDVYKNNKLLAYNENNKWGFKNKNGEIVIEAKYDRVTELNGNGFAGISQDGKWGSIDENGNVIIEPTYEINGSGDPDFIGKYYKAYSGYTESYYTNM